MEALKNKKHKKMDRYTLKWTSATVKLGEARSKVVNDALCKAMEGVKVDVVGSFMQRTALCSQDDDETNPTHVDMIATISPSAKSPAPPTN